MAEAESVDPDRLLTSDISRPRPSNAKKLLELARQSQSVAPVKPPAPVQEITIPEKGIPQIDIPIKGIPLSGMPDKSIPKKGTLKSNIAETRPSDEPITILTNYTKFDNDISDKLAHLQSLAEQAVYHRLYRLSWGYHRRTCRVGLGTLAKAIGISRSAAQRNLDSLVTKGYIVAYDDWSQEGRLYRILLPCELNLESKTLVGPPPESDSGQKIRLSDTGIPVEGIPSTGIDSIPNKGIPDLGYTSNEHTGIPVTGIPATDTNKEKVLLKKERNSLSRIVAEFYESIGQKRLSKQKRERGEQICQELLKDGFLIDDIRYACTWAVKNLTDLHSFSIIPEIIGQAMAAREQTQAKAHHEEQHRHDEEEKRRQYEVEQHQRKQAEEQRSTMTTRERQALRRQAEARIPDATKQVVDPQGAAYAKMLDAHELDILTEQQRSQASP